MLSDNPKSVTSIAPSGFGGFPVQVMIISTIFSVECANSNYGCLGHARIEGEEETMKKWFYFFITQLIENER